MDSKVKKPFYKRVWFWVIVVIVVIIAASMGGSKNNSSSATSATSSSSSAAASSSSSKVTVQKWTQADYDALTAGDIMNKGAGGTNMDELTDKFGKAKSTSDSTIDTTTTRTATWTNTNGDLGSSVILQFDQQDDGTWLLVSKASTGLK